MRLQSCPTCQKRKSLTAVYFQGNYELQLGTLSTLLLNNLLLFGPLTRLFRLPSMSDTDRKIELLKYTLSKREQFIKLLVLTKWGKNARKFQQCQVCVSR